MMTMKEKFQQVKKLLATIQSSGEARKAEENLTIAVRLMREIEGSMLANPYLQEQDLEWIVEFNRGPLWLSAQGRVEDLRKSA